MVSFKSLGTVSYSHLIARMDVSLAVSTQYTNVTDAQTPCHTDTARRHRPSLRIASRSKTDTIETGIFTWMSSIFPIRPARHVEEGDCHQRQHVIDEHDLPASSTRNY